MWKQTATFDLYDINCLVFITVVESVYCAVRTDSLCKADSFILWKVKGTGNAKCLSTPIAIHHPGLAFRCLIRAITSKRSFTLVDMFLAILYVPYQFTPIDMYVVYYLSSVFSDLNFKLITLFMCAG